MRFPVDRTNIQENAIKKKHRGKSSHYPSHSACRILDLIHECIKPLKIRGGNCAIVTDCLQFAWKIRLISDGLRSSEGFFVGFNGFSSSKKTNLKTRCSENVIPNWEISWLFFAIPIIRVITVTFDFLFFINLWYDFVTMLCCPNEPLEWVLPELQSPKWGTEKTIWITVEL